YGLHFSSERRGQVIIDTSQLDLNRFTLSDYSALGWFVGKQVLENIPIFPSLPSNISQEKLRFLLYPIPSAGAAVMVNIIGITPGVPTLEAALMGSDPIEVLKIGPKEINNVYETIRTAKKEHVDLVVFGCPHCSYPFIQFVAKRLNGKKISSGVRFWVSTSEYIRSLAKKTGLVDIIENAGGLVLSGMCVSRGGPWDDIEGVKVVATNVSMLAYNLRDKVDVIFGNSAQCITAAIKGRWEY
ncbi:aconitase X, partial [Thermodesulfobacteriota bacterium]